MLTNRKIDKAARAIEATLTYNEFDSTAGLAATTNGDVIKISVYLDKPVLKQLLENKVVVGSWATLFSGRCPGRFSKT